MDVFGRASKKSRFFGKVLSPSDLLNLGGPAGGSALAGRKRNRNAESIVKYVVRKDSFL